MTKAEERALEAYPIHPTLPNEVKDYIAAEQQAYRKGYEQAEKDLALTWEDIGTILQIVAKGDWYDFEISDKFQEFCEEVLKRFKETKK